MDTVFSPMFAIASRDGLERLVTMVSKLYIHVLYMLLYLASHDTLHHLQPFAIPLAKMEGFVPLLALLACADAYQPKVDVNAKISR